MAGVDPVSRALFNSAFSTIDTKFGTFKSYSNTNILDNWYLVDPINQRGSASYTTNGYTIDRWMNETIFGSVSVNSGFMTFTWNRILQSDYSAVIQPIEVNRVIVGREYTLSILAKGEGTLQLRAADTDNYCEITLTGTPTIYSLTVPSLSLQSNLARFRIIADGNHSLTGHIDIYAVKMELGSSQTLAHQDAAGNWLLNEIPNKTLELLKCQRYFERVYIDKNPYFLPATDTIIVNNFAYKVKKRIIPVIVGYPAYICRSKYNDSVFTTNPTPTFSAGTDSCVMMFTGEVINAIPAGGFAYIGYDAGQYFDVNAEL